MCQVLCTMGVWERGKKSSRPLISLMLYFESEHNQMDEDGFVTGRGGAMMSVFCSQSTSWCANLCLLCKLLSALQNQCLGLKQHVISNNNNWINVDLSSVWLRCDRKRFHCRWECLWTMTANYKINKNNTTTWQYITVLPQGNHLLGMFFFLSANALRHVQRVISIKWNAAFSQSSYAFALRPL